LVSVCGRDGGVRENNGTLDDILQFPDFPATRTAEVGSRRRPSRAFVDMLLEVQDGDALHEGFARCPRR